MAIDPTLIQRKALDIAQSELAEGAQRPPQAGAAPGAAKFEQLMEAPQGEAVAPQPAGAAAPGIERPQPAGPAADSASPAVVGDRILANLHPPDLAGTPSSGAVGATPGIDAGDPMQTLALQMKVNAIKTEVALEAAAVQKTTQGVDTLLKSQ